MLTELIINQVVKSNNGGFETINKSLIFIQIQILLRSHSSTITPINNTKGCARSRRFLLQAAEYTQTEEPSNFLKHSLCFI